MNKLSDEFLKYMLDTNKLSYSFDDFQNLKPDVDKDEIISALDFLKHQSYITYKSYDNLPAIIRLTPSAHYRDDADKGSGNSTGASETGKKKVFINWTALGVIITFLALLFSVLKEFL